MPEPWLRNTRTGIEPIRRAAIHALDLADEDLHRWCGQLSQEELHDTPHRLPSVAFQLRHIARSLDRLLTYAEGKPLSEEQLTELRSENGPQGTAAAIFLEFDTAIEASRARILALQGDFAEARHVGRDRIPTTLGGLIVHIADHTQRHTGQAITTAKVLLASR